MHSVMAMDLSLYILGVKLISLSCTSAYDHYFFVSAEYFEHTKTTPKLEDVTYMYLHSFYAVATLSKSM